MITIISGTNRAGSMTQKVSQVAADIAKSNNIEFNVIDLSTLSNDFIHKDQYNPAEIPAWLKELQEKSIIDVNRFLFIAPEYNGSIPGYLKLFIDAISVHRLKECFTDKQAALIGVASGRAGNLRGLDHLASILQALGCNVVPGSLPISKIGSVFDENNKIDEGTKGAISNLLLKLDKA